ncbi:glycerophosphodiester phosphodiesterase family protein [Dyadobacter sp. CY323]|uniref:glycerophosphodiester phosphodiesterase family protein n=1 Tax=Dyadobacter sp. CY323 TaxID=2907302 RepID=UPI001F1AD24C|nr:glycerophosphodiester phosphodiesterase family protein [Dyadobacter sp. CY323]MCE6989129.1 glycerophosphodiester phosphodiesterase family protein [Dyadobacter sp. CY323]
MILRKTNFTSLALLLFLAIPGMSQTNTLPHSENKVVVIAHRGNHVNVPENTLAAFREAITAGADYAEVDLRTTKDGHLVVLHDATVDRTTNGSGKVAEMTLADIKKLQVFNKNKKTHRIPEFKEVLEVCKGKINIYLDFKDANVAQTWSQIKALGMEKQVIVYLNKETQYGEWKEAAPHVPLMTSLPKEVSTSEHLKAFLAKINVQVLDNVTAPELVKVVNENGVSVWLDVQNPAEGPVSWKAVLEKGVQGLQTDKPAELRTYLNTHL